MGVLRVCSCEAIWVTKPKNRHISVASTGRHRPMITAASAMNPLPTVNSLENEPVAARVKNEPPSPRSEEHTSELQSRQYLVCRPLLEKKYLPISGPRRRACARPPPATCWPFLRDPSLP